MLTNKHRMLALSLVLALAVTNTGCDNKVKEAAKASDRIATLIGSLIDLKRELGPSGQTCQLQGVCISAEEELSLTNHLLVLNTRVRDFNNFARKFKEDSPQVRLDLAQAFATVTSAVNELSTSALFPIKSAEARKRLLAILNSINTSVQIVNVALKGE